MASKKSRTHTIQPEANYEVAPNMADVQEGDSVKVEGRSPGYDSFIRALGSQGLCLEFSRAEGEFDVYEVTSSLSSEDGSSVTDPNMATYTIRMDEESWEVEAASEDEAAAKAIDWTMDELAGRNELAITINPGPEDGFDAEAEDLYVVYRDGTTNWCSTPADRAEWSRVRLAGA